MNESSRSTLTPSPNGFNTGAQVKTIDEKSTIKSAAYKFRLYVADDSPNSAMARANLSALCDQYLPGHHEIEVVDVFREPVRAQEDEVTLTPMLIKLEPPPVCRIVGNLEDTQTLLSALDLESNSR